MILSLLERILNYQTKSGWIFEYVVQFQIKFALYDPHRGSSYIPLPSFVAHKKAVINVKDQNDQECFKWAVTSAVYPVKKEPQRLNNKMRENSEKFNWTGIDFPLSLKEIDKFEKQNDYGICVITYDEKRFWSRKSL